MSKSGQESYDEDEARFVEDHVQRLSIAHPDVFRICVSCHTRPPCMHQAIGLKELWRMAYALWEARPATHRRERK